MSKKPSGYEFRRRKAEKDLEFKKIQNCMKLDKFLTVKNQDVTNIGIVKDTENLSSETNEKHIETDENASTVPESLSCIKEFETKENLPENENLQEIAIGGDTGANKKFYNKVTVNDNVDNTIPTDSRHMISEEDVSSTDLSDLAFWPQNPDRHMTDYLILKGPIKIIMNNYPKDTNSRRFTDKLYYRKLSNNELILRRWLFYSKNLNRVFCFCCFCFDYSSKSSLANKGYSNWQHISTALKKHEISSKHTRCYLDWIESEKRLKNKTAIDNKNQLLISKEVDHWSKVLERLMNIILYLAENNMALRGSSDKLYTPNNGKYLGLIQLIAKFDPILQEHINRILRKEIADHYCGKNIANEFISLMGIEVVNQIVLQIQKAKYFSIIADCTPDISHTKQLSITIRYVNISNEKVEICERFLGFIPVLDSSDKGLSDLILEVLSKNNLDLKNCRGQGYDNGANMKGKHSGVQKRILDQNPLAVFLPCGCHSLNLVLCDAAKSSVKSITFFGILGRLYSLFAASTKRWNI